MNGCNKYKDSFKACFENVYNVLSTHVHVSKKKSLKLWYPDFYVNLCSYSVNDTDLKNGL